LLVTEVVMQGMSGWELAQQLQHQRPNLETLFISGHTENTAVPVGIVARDLHVLHKPFAAGALVRLVREILGSAKSPSVAEDGAREGRLVAIIDNNEAVRTAMMRVVEAAGTRAVAFPSAVAFLASDSVASIDCLVLDVQMPGMSGLQLQRHLVDRGLNIPIVFVTADDHPAIRAQALAAGAVRILRKAMVGNELIEAIEAAFRDRGEQR
jgi:FixJ family two-component response regulator